MELWPLYDQRDYAAFGCLFGVRNQAGYRPLAAGRGLPRDVSSGLRAESEPWVAEGHLTGATWVSWAEIAALDPGSAPDHYVGPLTADSILGGESHWKHVFAVMKALADRFGEEAVRLVVAFD
jgi:hypothetical protein